MVRIIETLHKATQQSKLSKISAGKPHDSIFFVIRNFISQRQSPRGKRCSVNIPQLFKRTPIQKCVGFQ